ncbi:MAG: bifunctional serine/threonine-protein kinase/formylglycine-generating enzyme family protein [Planctomycetota bacterium]
MKVCLTCEGVIDRDDATCAHCGGPLIEARAVAVPRRRGDDEAHGPLIGRVIDGKYRVVGVLGRGGMGVVYRALHEVSLIPVALKVLHPRWSMRPDFRGWFLAEARKAGRVLHEGSARVLDVGAAVDGTVYLAVELVEGQTLAEWLATHEHVDPACIVDLCEQVARAMAAAHAAGVVHRDLSPRNVMVSVRDGRLIAKVLDFGIAIGAPPTPRLGASDEAPELAPTGFANPPYSAPEHLAGRDVDARADIYSLGVILYEALSGQLPVAGSTSREFARETLEGRIRPLRPRVPVPRPLLRLCAAMLDPDRERRPASAQVVAETLHRLLHARNRLIAPLSVAALAVSLVVFALPFFREPSSVFLRARPNGIDLFEPVDPPALLEVQPLRTVKLLGTRFDFGGLSPEQLVLHVSRDGAPLFHTPLHDLLVQDGEVLRFQSAVAVAARIREVCAHGPVVLDFVHESAGTLAQARVLVDDTPPALALHWDRAGANGVALTGDDRLDVTIEDAGGVRSAWLEVDLLRSGAGPRGREKVMVPSHSQSATARELLGALLGDTRGFGACEIRLAAVDRADNEARSNTLECATLDLAVPDIVEVGPPGGGSVCVQDGRGVALRVRLAAPEPGVEVWVAEPGSDTFVAAAVASVGGDAGERLDLFLPPSKDGALLPSGTWHFRARDAVGNQSASHADELDIRSADPRPELRPVPRPETADRGITEFLGDFVADGGPWRLLLTVDPLYTPRRCMVTRADGAVVEARLEHERDGAAELVVDRIDSGDWQLAAEVADRRNGAVMSLPVRKVRVLRDPLELRIPGSEGAVFLPQLVERAILDLRGDQLAQGAGWQLRPDDPRLVRGRIWTRLGDTSVVRAVATGDSAEHAILPPLPIARGWHEILLGLEDVLGRPLRILLGDQEARAIPVDGGERAVLVARFFAHDSPVHAAQVAAPFEFGQPLRIAFTVDLPKVDGFAWKLSVRDAVVPPQKIEFEAERQILHFSLPFELAVEAADLGGVDAAGFAGGRDSRISARLATPAGAYDVVAPVRTIRTTLRAVQLGDLRADLPAEIAAIRLVPIPGPGVGKVFHDPVPRSVPGRERFRSSTAVDVRNLADFYLQDRELTRAQYRAIVAAGLHRAEILDAPHRAALRAVGDPLGNARLTAAALAPHGVAPDATASPESLERAVSGVDFHQAFAISRLLGLLLADDPSFLRLPLGVEMEVAAFGSSDRATVALNGSAVRGPGVDARLLAQERVTTAPLGWPPDARRCGELGDQVVTDLGDTVYGLDSGVREWVLDLPVVDGDPRGVSVLDEWRTDFVRHLERALRRVDGEVELDPAIVRRAVLRGIGAGEEFPLRGGTDGRLGADWPGVVRELQIRRDGAGLVPGTDDPYLALAGFRLVGGDAFVAEVRRR